MASENFDTIIREGLLAIAKAADEIYALPTPASPLGDNFGRASAVVAIDAVLDRGEVTSEDLRVEFIVRAGNLELAFDSAERAVEVLNGYRR